jgi:hypothetical protein
MRSLIVDVEKCLQVPILTLSNLMNLHYIDRGIFLIKCVFHDIAFLLPAILLVSNVTGIRGYSS